MKQDYTIGIDIGGTKIRAILLLSLGAPNKWKIIKSVEIKTPKTLPDFKKSLINLTSTWRFNRQVRKIGIAVPGPVRRNVFVSATNIPYIRNFDFGALFASEIRVDHDARAFARAEYRGNDPTLFLTLGTGIGRAFGKNGKILKIKKFENPEKWEKAYQTTRDSKNNLKFAEFLADNLSGLWKKYKPKILVVGGGVAERSGFLRLLGKSIRLRGFNVPIRKPKFGKNSVAIGAALNVAQ